MTARAQVAVVGATGYSGFELAKLLLRHPHLERPVFFLRDSGNGAPAPQCLTQVFPHLRGWGEAPCRVFSADAVRESGAQIVFLATPHEASLKIVPQLLRAGLRVVDLSGAFRFHHPATFENWYHLPAPGAELLGQAIYGMPELCADALPQARLVANPGCYPTSVILGLKPLLEARWLAPERGIVCDCKSGASGAGKEPRRELHFVEVDENFRAYGLFTHRHTPEVTEQLGLAPRDVIFSTHLLPIARGILSTLYVWLNEKRTAEAVEMLYRFFYASRPMVRIWPAGKLPELQHVVNTNFCDIGFALDEGGERLVIVSCLDNLGKGAAGQAVQNMNFMLGCAESAGLL
jgi:N-acetyl-gamma-glutamyl-phosphate reductase